MCTLPVHPIMVSYPCKLSQISLQMFAKDLVGGFSSQFWGEAATSSVPVDGLAPMAAGGPAPLPLTSPSGLSRVQFLVASQALGIPFFPNYCGAQGGLVGQRHMKVGILTKAGLWLEISP